MKRRVLCSLVLVLYLLAAATLLSRWIEAEMITQVQLREVPYEQYSGKTVELPFSSVFQEGTTFYLYEVVEGVGWEQGDRIQILPASNYRADMTNGIARLTCDRDYRVVRSASRFPKVGEKVQVLDDIRLTEDRYLAVYKGSIPEPSDRPFGKLVYGMEPLAQSDHALLLNAIRTNTPFLEHYIKGTSIITDAAKRIFSLSDVESFLKQLPLLAVLAALVIAPVELWAWSCRLLRRERWSLVAVNAVLAAAAGILIYQLLGRIDLPSSLMPTENIFKLHYYAQELRTVADALRDLGNPAPDIFASMEAARQGVLRAGLTGLLIPPAVIALEFAWEKYTEKRRPQA